MGTWRSKPGLGSVFLCVKEWQVYMPTLAQERSPIEVWLIHLASTLFHGIDEDK